MTVLCAFLRGVNIGNRQMKMDALSKSFDKAGFPGCRTVLASGNVMFNGPGTKATVEKLESQIETDFGFFAELILRDLKELETMAATGPFGTNKSDKDTKLYLYLARDPIDQSLIETHKIEGDFELIAITEREIYANAYRQETGRFGSGLDQLAKPFGRYFTSRNWNTILRLVAIGKDMEKANKKS